jgi:3-oxoacyl-[acyl-carrier protein] reductase
VTGASRGLGRAIALALAEEGADVIVNFRQNDVLAEEVVTEWSKPRLLLSVKSIFW